MSRKKKGDESIEIPITPMLDMAFQLLTFFILTYHPAPSEVQFVMNLMPAAPAINIKDAAPPAQDAAPNPNLPASLKTLPTVLKVGEGGRIGRILLSETEVPDLAAFKRELETYLKDPDLKFDQALISVDPGVKYSELVKVIDVFSELKLNKISFAETKGGEGG